VGVVTSLVIADVVVVLAVAEAVRITAVVGEIRRVETVSGVRSRKPRSTTVGRHAVSVVDLGISSGIADQPTAPCSATAVQALDIRPTSVRVRLN